MNNEPLSTKQLHEIITAQNMTIDRLLADKSHYMDVVRKLYDDIESLKKEIQFMTIANGFRDVLDDYL